MLLANALERVCVLEEQLERAQARIAELEVESPNGSQAVPPPTSEPASMHNPC